ncbi:helix-turn-helix domain-containing protein [Streptomyces libani]|uniref:helix-turn-helix domain-containing protein n=1 Tax=Streptomyces nigrescens TaxID=1920 RepID=UPI003636348A
MGRGTGSFDGEVLRLARRAKGLSAAELAALLGTSKAAILAYESGKRVPEARRVAQLARTLEVHSAAFCPLDDTELVLAAMRRQQGLTAAQLAERIGVSRSTYRRIELEARLPSRGGGAVPVRLAEALGVPLHLVQRALEVHPSAVARRAKITDHLTGLFQRAHHLDHPAVVDPDEAQLRDVATLLGHATSLVCRLVNHELGEYRTLLKQRDQLAVEVSYAQSDRIRRMAEYRMAQQNERIAGAADRSTDFLIRFLAEALTFRQWRLLVYMARMAILTPLHSPLHEFPESFDPDTLPTLVERRHTGKPLVRVSEVRDLPLQTNMYSLTEAGLGYYETTRPVYGLLYPRLWSPPVPRTALAHRGPHANRAVRRS